MIVDELVRLRASYASDLSQEQLRVVKISLDLGGCKTGKPSPTGLPRLDTDGIFNGARGEGGS